MSLSTHFKLHILVTCTFWGFSIFLKEQVTKWQNRFCLLQISENRILNCLTGTTVVTNLLDYNDTVMWPVKLDRPINFLPLMFTVCYLHVLVGLKKVTNSYSQAGWCSRQNSKYIPPRNVSSVFFTWANFISAA